MLKFQPNWIIQEPESHFAVRFNVNRRSPYYTDGHLWPNEGMVWETQPLSSICFHRWNTGIFALFDFLEVLQYIAKCPSDPKDIQVYLLNYDGKGVIFQPPHWGPLEFRHDILHEQHEIILSYAHIDRVFTLQEYRDAIETGYLSDVMAACALAKRFAYQTHLSTHFDLPEVYCWERINKRDMQAFLRIAKQECPIYSSEFHGLRHWKWVANAAFVLAFDAGFSQVDIVVCMWFAVFHDCQCHAEDNDATHGERACGYIDRMRQVCLADLTDEQVEKLKKACAIHTTATEVDDLTIGICIDADRLHLWRVGRKPDPKRMVTKYGRAVARRPYRKWGISNARYDIAASYFLHDGLIHDGHLT